MVERITSRRLPSRNTAGQEGGDSPSASGSEDVLQVAHQIVPGEGLRWARSTDADGEGDVREACATKSAPAALTTALSIDACSFVLEIEIEPHDSRRQQLDRTEFV